MSGILALLLLIFVVAAYMRYAPRFAKDEESARVVHADRVLPGKEPRRRIVDLTQAAPIVVQPPPVPLRWLHPRWRHLPPRPLPPRLRQPSLPQLRRRHPLPMPHRLRDGGTRRGGNGTRRRRSRTRRRACGSRARGR